MIHTTNAMWQRKLFRISGTLLMIFFNLGWIDTARAQYFTASFLQPYETEAIGNGLYAFRIGIRRSLFVVCDEGVIVTDPLNVDAARLCTREIANVTDQPVRHVAYTSSFLNHVKGGNVFKNEGARFIGQEKYLANMRETPHADVILPDITFTDNYKLELGGKALELY